MAHGCKPSVSLTMIVRNEERNLADCLAPVAPLFDEIVIVDTGSNDRTRQIALDFTPHVFDFPWCEDFSAARNESLRRVRGDWVFWLDADDRVSVENSAKLRCLLAGLNDQPQVFMMETVSLPAEASCEPWVVLHPRLFRRHPELRWQGRVHEQLRPEPRALGYQIVATEIQIEHVGYQDAGLRHRKRQRKLRLLKMEYAVNPEDASTLFHLGMAHAEYGTKAEARKHFLHLLEMQSGPADYVRRVYCALAELSLSEGKLQEALRFAAQGLASFPRDEQLLYVQAQILYELEEHAAARAALETIIRGGAVRQLAGGGRGLIQCKLALRMLGAVLRMQQEYAGAAAALRSVLERFPCDALSWYYLGLVYLDTNDAEQLGGVIRCLQGCPEGKTFGNLLRAVWHLRHDELGPAGMLIEDLVSEAPQMPLPRMLRLEWLSRIGAPPSAQAQAATDLLRIQPNNAQAARWLQCLEEIERSAQIAPGSDWCSSIVLMPGVVAAVPGPWR